MHSIEKITPEFINPQIVNRMTLDFEGHRKIGVNSRKPLKHEAVNLFAQAITGEKLNNDPDLAFQIFYEEPACVSAVESAKDKALALHAHSPEKIVAGGADGAFWIFDGTQWKQLHSIKRNSHVTQDDIINEYYFLRENLVYPKTANHRVYCAWNQGAAFMPRSNTYLFSDWIFTRSRPLDLMVFQEKFTEAVENGLFYSANARMDLFGVLADSNLIETIGFVPTKYLLRKVPINRFMAKCNEELIRIGKAEVLSTVPYSLFGLANAAYFAEKLAIVQ